MFEIGAFQAKNTLGSLLDRVENGEEVVITRHGRPVARLVPDFGSRSVALQRVRAKEDTGRSPQILVEHGRIVQLPEEFALRAREVSVRREGNEIILSPRTDGWSKYLEDGPFASENFMDNVDDLPPQERD